ncbi:MAG: molybdopterin-dependent oxidoreductase [Deltaproteobacteria bacterium]|nr:molybdopterin-dependent oxidoreductase [Deltaproteobacteria bacterium]
MKSHSSNVSRRTLLFMALQGAGALLLGGCKNVFDQIHQNKTILSILESAEGLNQKALRLLTPKGALAKEFSEKEISSYFKPNGNPPPLDPRYVQDGLRGWASWRLEVTGHVNNPGKFSLNQVKKLPSRTQITRHDCVEGWSAIAKWKGVPLSEIIKLVQPKPVAKYIIFYCMDVDSQGVHFYQSIDLLDAMHPQTILAYEMNDKPLPVQHGAPIRLRLEMQLGYKMAKYISKIELVSSLDGIGGGRGGYWEDLGYSWYAGI